jgi:peptidoglycan/xylan/chitin deacetylase (PgdA/CDA1 family)
LSRVQATATLYVPTGYLGALPTWLRRNADRFGRLMTQDQVKAAAAAGVEIGSHGHIHEPLDVVPANVVRAQLSESRSVLAEATGFAPRSFCYPHGYNSSVLRGIVRGVGFDNACAIGHYLHRTNRDRFRVSRILVNPAVGPTDLLNLVTVGPPQIQAHLKRLATPAWRYARRFNRQIGRKAWS